MQDRKDNDRQESYPRPSDTDTQLNNQPEYIDQQPNDFIDRSISDVPQPAKPDVSIANDPSREKKRD